MHPSVCRAQHKGWASYAEGPRRPGQGGLQQACLDTIWPGATHSPWARRKKLNAESWVLHLVVPRGPGKVGHLVCRASPSAGQEAGSTGWLVEAALCACPALRGHRLGRCWGSRVGWMAPFFLFRSSALSSGVSGSKALFCLGLPSRMFSEMMAPVPDNRGAGSASERSAGCPRPLHSLCPSCTQSVEQNAAVFLGPEVP